MGNKITIYTDGAASGNGTRNAKGGWGYVIYWQATQIRKDEQLNEKVPVQKNTILDIFTSRGGRTGYDYGIYAH